MHTATETVVELPNHHPSRGHIFGSQSHSCIISQPSQPCSRGEYGGGWQKTQRTVCYVILHGARCLCLKLRVYRACFERQPVCSLFTHTHDMYVLLLYRAIFGWPSSSSFGASPCASPILSRKRNSVFFLVHRRPFTDVLTQSSPESCSCMPAFEKKLVVATVVVLLLLSVVRP